RCRRLARPKLGGTHGSRQRGLRDLLVHHLADLQPHLIERGRADVAVLGPLHAHRIEELVGRDHQRTSRSRTVSMSFWILPMTRFVAVPPCSIKLAAHLSRPALSGRPLFAHSVASAYIASARTYRARTGYFFRCSCPSVAFA